MFLFFSSSPNTTVLSHASWHTPFLFDWQARRLTGKTWSHCISFTFINIHFVSVWFLYISIGLAIREFAKYCLANLYIYIVTFVFLRVAYCQGTWVCSREHPSSSQLYQRAYRKRAREARRTGWGGSFQFSVSMVTSFCPASICVSGVEQRETEQRKKDCGGMKGKQRMKSIYRTREEKREESEKEHGADNGVHGDLVRD